MRRKKFMPFLVEIVLSLLLAACASAVPSLPSAPSARSAAEPAVTADIFNATVQMTMSHRQATQLAAAKEEALTAGKQVTQVDTTTATGIGTLISLNGETLLLTHDHWPALLAGEPPQTVQFHDAHGRLLAKISGESFSANVLFHDMGTLIMRPPAELKAHRLVPATVTTVDSLSVGHIVTLVHRQPGGERLGLVAAEIQAIAWKQGIPHLQLNSLNGKPVKPGDSGGGVWLNGRIVGNMWMGILEVDLIPFSQEITTAATGRSIAAGLTANLIDLIEILQTPAALPLPTAEISTNHH